MINSRYVIKTTCFFLLDLTSNFDFFRSSRGRTHLLVLATRAWAFLT